MLELTCVDDVYVVDLSSQMRKSSLFFFLICLQFSVIITRILMKYHMHVMKCNVDMA